MCILATQSNPEVIEYDVTSSRTLHVHMSQGQNCLVTATIVTMTSVYAKSPSLEQCGSFKVRIFKFGLRFLILRLR